MSNKPTILVTGATGAQGGSVARALLKSNNFHVRCLTRNPLSDQAIILAAAGAEVIAGDLNDTASLKAAMHDCYGVFGVTNFWEHFEEEYQQGKNLTDAVKQSSIKHFVFSTLPDYYKLSGQTLGVPHCDLKASLETYTKSLGIPATFIHVAFYYENFLSFFPPTADDNVEYYFGFAQGDTKLAMASVEDTGGVVASVFDHREVYTGRTVGVVGEDRTCTEYAAAMSKALEHTVHYAYIPREIFAAYGFPGAEELANMFEVQRLFIPERSIDLIESYGLNPAMQRFEDWLLKNKCRFTMFSAKKQQSPAW